MNLTSTTLLLTLVQSAVFAQERDPVDSRNPEVVAAEFNRLSDRLSRLAKKGQWAGAERIYRKLVTLNRPLTHSQLLICAEVERRIGDLQATYLCLREAAKLDGTREVIDWLVALEDQTGEARLSLSRGASPELQTLETLFLPEHQAALSFATESLRESRSFDGRLPIGRYILDGVEFRVESTEKVEVGQVMD